MAEVFRREIRRGKGDSLSQGIPVGCKMLYEAQLLRDSSESFRMPT